MLRLPRPRAATSGWAGAFLIWLVLTGCDVVDHPDRFIDNTVQPPLIAAVDYATVRSGQHLAGEVVLTATLDSLGDRVERVVLTVDGAYVDEVFEAPYTLRVETRQFADGPATLGLEVYERESRQGLLGLAGVPSIALFTPVVFDQSPPTTVENLSGTWSDDGVTLRWTPNRDPNFFAYIVIREDTWSDVPDEGSAFGPRSTVLDTLYDASIRSYREPDVPSVYGLQSTYRVTVSNRAETAFFAHVLAEYGVAQSVDTYWSGLLLNEGIFHPSRHLAYYVDGDYLHVVSTATGSLTATIDLYDFVEDESRENGTYTDYGRLVDIQPDGSEVYVYRSNPASGTETSDLLVFSGTEQPAFLRRLDAIPDDAAGVRLGPDGFLTARVSDQIRVYDAADGQLKAPLSGAPASATVHRAGDRLLTQHLADASGECVLTIYDPATGTAGEQATYPFDGMSCWNVHATDDGDALYLVSTMESRFRRVDVASMDVSAVTDFPVPPGDLVDRVRVDGDRLFLGVSSNERPCRRGLVLEVDASGQTVFRTWGFASPVERIVPSADGTSLFVFASPYASGRMWRIPRAN